MNALRHFRAAARGLLRAPGYSAAFVFTLALGIGVNAAIFSVIHGVLLRPLPVPSSERIMVLKQPALRAGVDNASFSFVEVQEYRERARSFDEVVEFGDWSFDVVGQGDPHPTVAGLVTSNYFTVMGMRPALGRLLTSADDAAGAEPVLVLTDPYWQRVFGADSAVIGRTVQLTGKSTRIVGVLQPGSHYTGTRRPDFYANYSTNDHYMGASMQHDRAHRMTDVFARLAPGAGMETARRELETIAAGMRAEYPDAYPEGMGYGIAMARWRDELTRNARPTFLILMAAVGVVLLLACANVANLSLTRIIRRESELSTRAALGGSRTQIRVGLLAEYALLSVAGSLLGVILAKWTVDLLTSYAERFTVRTGEISIDATVLAFALAIALVFAFALAWAPGLPVDPRIGSAAGAGGRVHGGRKRRRLQQGLVVLQLALSFGLLMGAGLLVRSLANLWRVDPGFDDTNVLVLETSIRRSTLPEQRTAMTRVIEEARAFPGVRAAAIASWVPLAAFEPLAWSFRIDGAPADNAVQQPSTFNAVSGEYFGALGVPLLAGRLFSHHDVASADSVIIINKAMADAAFPGQDPIGHTLQWSLSRRGWSPPATIIGVVADTRDVTLATSGVPVVYAPMMQSHPGGVLIVKTRGEPGPLANHLTQRIHHIDPDAPVFNVRTLADVRAESVAPDRLNATLFAAFAVLALIIAAVGVFAVLWFSVSQRTREFGVRMVLGADKGRILRTVLGEGVVLVVVALALGAVLAAGTTRLLAGLLFGVEPLDPATFGAAAVILGAAALIAASLPARRAVGFTPADALRSD